MNIPLSSENSFYTGALSGENLYPPHLVSRFWPGDWLP